MAIAGDETTGTTLHDAVSAAFEQHIPDAANPPASSPESVPLPSAQPAAAAPVESQEAKEARERDEKGRITAKDPAAPPAKAATTPPAKGAEPAPAAAAEPPKPLSRPSSWK